MMNNSIGIIVAFQSPFKRQLSLRLNDLPSNLERTRSMSLDNNAANITNDIITTNNNNQPPPGNIQITFHSQLIELFPLLSNLGLYFTSTVLSWDSVREVMHINGCHTLMIVNIIQHLVWTATCYYERDYYKVSLFFRDYLCWSYFFYIYFFILYLLY